MNTTLIITWLHLSLMLTLMAGSYETARPTQKDEGGKKLCQGTLRYGYGFGLGARNYKASITVYYFAKEEEESCKFAPELPEVYRPVQIPFNKGLERRFQQPSGTGVDLGFFELEALGKPSEDDVFPLVIYAEVYPSSEEADDEAGGSPSGTSPRVQVTQAVIEKKSDSSFQVKVSRQILWIDGIRYEVHELFGVGNSSEQSFNDDDPGKACVICMTEAKDTAVIPCRHLCVCSDCAKELRLRTNKCPICREPITELIEIKIDNTGR